MTMMEFTGPMTNSDPLQRARQLLRRVTDRLPPPAILVPLCNLAGSALLGLLVAGAWGLVAGPLLLAGWLAVALIWRRIASLRPTMPAPRPPHPAPVSGSAPPPPGRPLWIEAVAVSAGRTALRPVATLFSEASLPFTMLNLGLLAVLATLVIGIDFAFWLALGAVPIVLIGLMLMSLGGQEDTASGSEDEEA
jgi:hypothetical protein